MRFSPLLFSFLLIFACGDDDAATDSGTDTGTLDVGAMDTGSDDASVDDAGSDATVDDAGADASADAGGDDAGSDASVDAPPLDVGPDGTSCDTRTVTCDVPEPVCEGDFMVPSVMDGCYGPCVAIGECACAGPADCPDPDQYTCNMSANRCTPFL